MSDVQVTVPVPTGTRGKQCEVKISRRSLSVGLKGQEPILNGDLSETIKEDDCLWNMDGDNIDISLRKFKGMTWWKAVLKGEPEINTQKVCMCSHAPVVDDGGVDQADPSHAATRQFSKILC